MALLKNTPKAEASEKWEAQLRKGCLELAILASLWEKRLYGLEILRVLEASSNLVLAEGTVCPMIEDYFPQLDAKMSDLPQADRQEFVCELRAHVLDRLDQATVATEGDCRAVLKALGTPEEIARQYRLERIMSRSAWRISPLSV